MPTRKETVGLLIASPLFLIIFLVAYPVKAVKAACEYLDEVFPLGRRDG